MSASMFSVEQGPVSLEITGVSGNPAALNVKVHLEHEIQVLVPGPDRGALAKTLITDPAWWTHLAESSLAQYPKEGGLDRAAALAVAHALLQHRAQEVA